MSKTKNKNTKNRKNINRSNKTLINKINNIFCCLIIISGIYYIFGVNDLSIKGFKIYDLKTKLSDLSELQENLETEAMKFNKYDYIIMRANELNLVKAEQIDYITAVSAVAIKD